MIPFAPIRKRAQTRKGGAAALAHMMPRVLDAQALAAVPDHRYLAEIARRVFCAGFAWRVIDAKWAGFEEAFLGFKPLGLALQPDHYWDALTQDKRIVRNGTKIQSVRENAMFVETIAQEYGSFGAFLAQWPAEDQLGLLKTLHRRGHRLGGNTGQVFLRVVGWDAWMITPDVVFCLREAGLDIREEATSVHDRRLVQQQFNAWHLETGLPRAHLSKICALSVGINYPESE